MMKIKILHIEILLFLFITGCGSDSNSSTPFPTSGNCPNGQSLGCDDNCSLSPPENDVCGICGGYGSTCEDLWHVFYDVDIPIAGFQFGVNEGDIINAFGGSTTEAGLLVSHSSSIVLAFSLSGVIIPSGTGILISLEIDGDINSVCLTAPIISDTSGVALDVEIINCNTIKSS